MRNYKQRKFKKKKFEYVRGKKPPRTGFIIPHVVLLLSALASLIILFIMPPNNYQPENDQSWQFLLRNGKGIAFVIFLILLVPIIMWLINRTAKRFKTD